MKPSHVAASLVVLLSASVGAYEWVQAREARALLASRTEELSRVVAARDFEAAQAAGKHLRPASPPAAEPPAAARETAAVSPDGAAQARRARLHGRYDRLLFGKLHFSDAQAEQFIDLMIQKEDVRADIVAAIKENGLAGDDPGVQKLRDQLNLPITQQLQSLLGSDGSAAYRQFEMQAFYQTSYVAPFATFIPATVPALTEQQGDVLALLMSANDHPLPPVGTNLSSESHIDWTAVLSQLNGTLTPEQTAALQAYIQYLGRSGH